MSGGEEEDGKGAIQQQAGVRALKSRYEPCQLRVSQ